jgi:type I restriction enzyme M protein
VDFTCAYVDNSKIADCDYNLAVNTYVVKNDKKEEIDIQLLNTQISQTVEKINYLRSEIDEIVGKIEI